MPFDTYETIDPPGSNRSPSYASSISEITEYFTTHRKLYAPKRPTHVVHTNTIPLAGMLNTIYKGETRELHHGTLADNCHCKRENCMFAPKGRPRQPEIVTSQCPCLGESLIPICFLEALKLANHRVDISSSTNEDAAGVMPGIVVCPNGTGIFSRTYPGSVRDDLGVSGWQNLESSQMEGILDHTYWFKKYASSTTRRLLRSQSSNRSLKTWIFQIIGTIDGLLNKCFLAFGPEIGTYHEIAEKTNRLFSELLKDYTTTPIMNATEFPETTYGQIKPFLMKAKKDVPP
jgi:hypothetical protein